ncbi:hypothetical protein LWI28_025269 [Acer negundo]|uniref:Uncharacterized protein n=1 Tax=Acer negundo TaxID=4023 RepID=A0AAD5IWF0_ACENE|nr:hypothetical protein LWI28_025269 [Acer negundo]
MNFFTKLPILSLAFHEIYQHNKTLFSPPAAIFVPSSSPVSLFLFSKILRANLTTASIFGFRFWIPPSLRFCFYGCFSS